MKKQPQKRSPRYRFWRNVGIITVSGLIGGVIGVLTGMFGSEKPIEIQSFFSTEVLYLGSAVLFLIVFMIFYSQLMSMDRPGTGNLFFIFGDFTMLYLFLILIALFFLSDIFFRKTFHLIYGKTIPRNANAKEVREFMMSMMDEAEKQISYEENYEIIIKLSNYILPFALIGIFLIGTFFHTDILLALVVVSLIYLYILVSQYKITKRYYKE